MVTEPQLTPDQAREIHRGCFYCGLQLSYSRHVPMNDPSKRTVDHIIARKMGGSNEKANKVLACHACNRRKKNMNLEEYRAFLYGDRNLEFFGETLLRQWGVKLVMSKTEAA